MRHLNPPTRRALELLADAPDHELKAYQLRAALGSYARTAAAALEAMGYCSISHASPVVYRLTPDGVRAAAERQEELAL